MKKITQFLLLVFASLNSFAQESEYSKEYYPRAQYEAELAKYRNTPLYIFLRGEPFSLEVKDFISKNHFDTYTYPCASKVSDKSKLNIENLSTKALYKLMTKTEYEIYDFLECSKAVKKTLPLSLLNSEGLSGTKEEEFSRIEKP